MKGEDTYFLVWTTTPWTLMANLALCVNPKEKYVKVNSKGYNFILAKDLVNTVLGDDIEIVEEYKGKDLEGIEYEQFMPFVKVKGKAFEVLCDDGHRRRREHPSAPDFGVSVCLDQPAGGFGAALGNL